jgi:hypothetical protein
MMIQQAIATLSRNLDKAAETFLVPIDSNLAIALSLLFTRKLRKIKGFGTRISETCRSVGGFSLCSCGFNRPALL